MERTELREQFFAEAMRDPYAHMVTRMWTEAWASGYEQALRDNGLTHERLRKSFHERVYDALEFLTEAKRKSEAEFVLAMASLARHKDEGPAGADPSSRL